MIREIQVYKEEVEGGGREPRGRGGLNPPRTRDGAEKSNAAAGFTAFVTDRGLQGKLNPTFRSAVVIVLSDIAKKAAQE